MNLKILKLFIVLFIFFLSGYSFSQEMNSNNHDSNYIKDSLEIHEMHKKIKDSLARSLVEKIHMERMQMPNYKSWNEVCPVLGYKVDHKVKPIEYNGKLYGFCCKVCHKNFSENPGKYVNNLDKYGIKFIGKK
ncbi:MAG: YHS domain-containing protein [Bacteroidetes bacterium]|nr:YHS domain-containing protein [Bacteroidota bacterium]